MRAVCNWKRRTLTLTIAASLLASWPGRSAAGDLIESQASRARGGAGLRVGIWQVRDLADPPSGTASESANYEGWFQKGLDLHLVLESTLGFWQRTESSTEPGPLATETKRDVNTYLVPAMTAVKLYPVTRPSSPLEPYVSAGVGAVMRIQRNQVSSTDPMVLPVDETSIQTGLGIQTGAGVDWNPPGPFGVRLGGQYQWASFGENTPGTKLYRGPGVSVGVTYHFRYQ
jgi:opacity protein-like surface antigen